MRTPLRISLLILGLVFAGQQRRAKAHETLPPQTTGATAIRATSSESLVIPVAGIRREALRDSFGAARTGHRHEAIDILAPRGTPALAAVDGTISRLDTGGSGGRTIYLAAAGGHTLYYYAHLDDYAEGLAEGAEVHAGDVIGYVGTTGNAPPNTPHLHFAIEEVSDSRHPWSGEAVNPFPLLVAQGVTRR